MSRHDYPAAGKIYVRVPLRMLTPAIIGSGESEASDVDIVCEPCVGAGLRRANAAQNQLSYVPLLPATSWLGVFRAYLEKGLRHLPEHEKIGVRKNFHYLFGARMPRKKENPKAPPLPQSALQCEDVLLERGQVVLRDGVAIDQQRNTAIARKKFTYEVLECQSPFDVQLEATLREPFDRDIFMRLLATMVQGIEQGHIRLGAKTNKGFGRLALAEKSIKIAKLNFAEAEHVQQWLSGKPVYETAFLNSLAPFEFSPRQFQIDAWFRLKNSLLVKAYEVEPSAPDAGHIKSNGKFVLPGTSIMGAVRHRAHKILKTVGAEEASLREKTQALFGYEGEASTGKGARRGRVRIEETPIQNPLAEIQARIKIDRFTGGTMPGALFEMMPLWRNATDEAVHVAITLQDYATWEAGLLLYVLKDLWTGDLPIGGEKNVGRGVLQGVRATIRWGEEPVQLRADQNGALMTNKDFNRLEYFAEKLVEELKR